MAGGGGVIILALDVATTTGWALGRPGESLRAGSHRFGKPSDSDHEIFALAMDWIAAFLERDLIPDIVIFENLLPPSVVQGETHTGVYARLAGLQGILKAMAHRYGVGEISGASVQSVRRHFLGYSPKREVAKAETMAKCRALGWPCPDNNAADALALWHYAASLIKPELALEVSPMFNRRLRHG